MPAPRLAPPARPPRSRLPRPLRPPGPSPPTILSAWGARPHSLPSSAKSQARQPPCHRVANGKCPVPGAPRSFPRRPFRKEKAQPQTRVLGAGPQPCPPSLSPAGPALVQDAAPIPMTPLSPPQVRSFLLPNFSEQKEVAFSTPWNPASRIQGCVDSEWERPTSIRLQLSHSREPPSTLTLDRHGATPVLSTAGQAALRLMLRVLCLGTLSPESFRN